MWRVTSYCKEHVVLSKLSCICVVLDHFQYGGSLISMVKIRAKHLLFLFFQKLIYRAYHLLFLSLTWMEVKCALTAAIAPTLDENIFPSGQIFKFANKKKSDGATLREYGRLGTSWMPDSCNFSLWQSIWGVACSFFFFPPQKLGVH